MPTFRSSIISFSLIFILILISVPFRLSAQQEVLGIYWTPDKDAKIKIYQKGDFYRGKLVWSTLPDLTDGNNPDPSLRDRLILGTDIMYGFTYDPANEEWVDGKIYDSRDGKTYDCEMWLAEKGNILKVRGYLGFSLLGVTKDFPRVMN